MAFKYPSEYPLSSNHPEQTIPTADPARPSLIHVAKIIKRISDDYNVSSTLRRQRNHYHRGTLPPETASFFFLLDAN